MNNNKTKTINLKNENKVIKRPIKITNIISKTKINPINVKNIKKIEKKKKLKNKELEDFELNGVIQRKTFIETKNTNNCIRNNYIDKIHQYNKNNYFYSFIENYSNPINKYISNRNKLTKRNNYKKNNLTINIIDKNNKKNLTTFTHLIKKEKEKKVNNIKISKNKIDTYNNKKTYLKNEVPNARYDISTLFSKNTTKIKKIKLIPFQKKKNILKKQKKINNGTDLHSFFDIESEHKNSINLINNCDFKVNKPHEHDMKYTIMKEYEEEESNLDNKKEEKIVIGKIDGYQDIIESDKINDKNNNKNKSTRNHISKYNDKKMTNEKIKLDFIEKYFEGLYILEDNSSEFFDLNLKEKYCMTNENIMRIENEYQFENLPTNQ